MKKPPPQLHPELAAAIREALERSPQPVKLAKLRSLLPTPFKVPPKLKDALLALLNAEAQAGRLHLWPAEKYWTRDAKSWAAPAMLAAASAAPVAATKVIGAVAKVYGRPASVALLEELLATGQLIRVPLFGGAKAKLCSRIVDEAAFRAELDAARAVLEAGYRRLGVAPIAATAVPPPTSTNLDDQILDAIATLEPRKGLLITAPRLYRALAGLHKHDVDTALVRLQDARRVILHRHSNPQSQPQDQLIANLYVGACWRVQE